MFWIRATTAVFHRTQCFGTQVLGSRFLPTRLYAMMSTKPQGLEHEELFEGVTALVKEYMIKYNDRSSKVVDFKSPDEIRKLIDVTVKDEGVDDKTLLELCRTAMDYSVHTVHPRFYNQLFSGVDEVGLMGQFLTAAANTSMYTFEMAPVFSLMEGEVLAKMRSLIGWEDGDGIFSPGGSLSNMYGLLLSRFKQFPEMKLKGIQSLPPMVVFCSEQSHYSISKMSIVMGFGMENVIKVKCDKQGRMLPEDLDKQITEAKSKGFHPMTVVATSGTTVLGAFDPLVPTAEVCKKHSVWLHVDAACGGSVLVSRKHRKLMEGSHLVDSVTWNPHKSMTAPLQCSAFLTKHKGLLPSCLSTKATYLFQQDKVSYDVSLDTGDKSVQCGRLNDILKLWLMWKSKGTFGFEKHLDKSMEVAGYLADQVRAREGFELALENPEYTNISFWYLPPCLRHINPSQCSKEEADRLSKVASTIKGRMVKKGSVMVGYQPLPGKPNFFRMVVVAPKATKEDMDFLLDEIELLGKDLDV